MTGPVVILGTGRCGSSLVGQLFEWHMPYRFEPRMADLRPPPPRRECWKLPYDDDRRTPGCRVDVDELVRLGATVLWLVRHPLDTACSAVPLWESDPAREAATHGEAAGVAWAARRDPLLAGVVAWLGTNGVGLETCRAAVPTVVVRYEDVVADPSGSGRELLGAAGVEADDGLVDGWAVGVGVAKRRGDEDPRQADLWWTGDHTRRVGRWAENVPPEAVDPLWTIARPVAERFGYTV